MEDILLLCAIAAMFALGYFIVKRVDAFLAENQRLLAQETLGKKQLIQVAAETPMLLGSVAWALKSCSDANPCIEFAVSSGEARVLLRKLKEGTVDLVLLTEDAASDKSTGFEHMTVPYCRGFVTAEAMGLPVGNFGEGAMVCILWNPAVASWMRDQVICALHGKAPQGGK